jgi:hypothetical protein
VFVISKKTKVAIRLTPTPLAINPTLEAGAAPVAVISGGISRIAGSAQDTIEGRVSLRNTVGHIKQQAMAVEQAYGGGRWFHLHQNDDVENINTLKV